MISDENSVFCEVHWDCPFCKKSCGFVSYDNDSLACLECKYIFDKYTGEMVEFQINNDIKYNFGDVIYAVVYHQIGNKYTLKFKSKRDGYVVGFAFDIGAMRYYIPCDKVRVFNANDIISINFECRDLDIKFRHSKLVMVNLYYKSVVY